MANYNSFLLFVISCCTESTFSVLVMQTDTKCMME